MFDYLVRRLLLLIPTFFGITLIVFVVIQLAPGDPAALRGGEVSDPEQSERIVQEIRARYHLDEPIHMQYWLWLKQLVTLDLGNSLVDDNPVVDKIAKAFMPTFSVNVLSIVLAFLLSLPIGIYAAARRGGVFDGSSGVLLYVLYSIPSYVGAIVLVMLLKDVLPFRGMVSDNHEELSTIGKFWDIVQHMTLYVVCVTYGSLAFYSRFVRQNMLEVVQQDYIRTARAKGLGQGAILLKHAFRNTLIPFLTLLGLVVPSLIGGSVILEQIFTWPGLGRLFFTSILQRDFPTVMALTTATALLVQGATLTVDLLYGVVDPRVSHR